MARRFTPKSKSQAVGVTDARARSTRDPNNMAAFPLVEMEIAPKMKITDGRRRVRDRINIVVPSVAPIYNHKSSLD